MAYTEKEFARELKAQLDLGYEPERIGNWAHKVFMKHCGHISDELEEILLDLFVLEEGPEFEVPESELRELVKRLEGPDKKFNCRVCGHKQGVEPWGEDGKTPTFDVCKCCGVLFGYQDSTPQSAREFREEWLRAGGKWAVLDEMPSNWTLEEQLKDIPDEYTDISS